MNKMHFKIKRKHFESDFIDELPKKDDFYVRNVTYTNRQFPRHESCTCSIKLQ